MNVRDTIFVIIYAALQFPAIAQPWVAVLVWVWIDYMNPHRLCYGFVHWAVPVALISSVVTFLSMAISSERIRFPFTRETVVLLLFVGWISVTTIFALNPKDAQEQWATVVKIQVLIVVTLIVLQDAFRVQALVWTIVVSLGFYGIKGGVFTILKGGAHRVYGPLYSFIQDNNDIALALVTVIPLMRFMMLRAGNRWMRWGMGVSIVLTGVAVLGSYSRGGLIGLAGMTLLMVLKSRKKLLFSALIVMAGLWMATLMPEEWFNRMNTISDYENDGSAIGRINAWRFAINVANDRPLTGGGFKVFTPRMFRIYAPTNEYREAHSIYFRILGEHGYIGLGLFLLLAFLTWRSATWIIKTARIAPELTWAGDLVSMTQVSLAAFGIGGAFLSVAYFDLPYHLMTIIVICKLHVRRHLFELEAKRSAPPTSVPVEVAVAYP